MKKRGLKINGDVHVQVPREIKRHFSDGRPVGENKVSIANKQSI